MAPKLDRRAAVLALVVAAGIEACGPHLPVIPPLLDDVNFGPFDATRDDAPTCAMGLTVCNDLCVDTQVDMRHCGACGAACAPGQACTAGQCADECVYPTQRCNAGCADLAIDPQNCGACQNACTTMQRCDVGRCVDAPLVRGATFRVRALDATSCASADVAAFTGEDRGRLAVSPDVLYTTGSLATATFTLDALAHAHTEPTRTTWILGNLRDASVYVFANGASPVGDAGGTATSLIALAGPAVGQAVNLSEALVVDPAAGLFAGFDRVAVYTDGHLFDVALPSGLVTDFGAMPAPAHLPCAAGWGGTVENFDGALYLDTVASATSVVRTRVPDGATMPLAAFDDLGAMCGFTLSLASNAWYFGAGPGGSQFGAGEATLGRCDAAWDQPPAPGHYIVADPPASVAWVDACAAPGSTTLLPAMDDAAAFVPLAFALRYWTAMLPAASPVNVATNGFLSLDGAVDSSLTGAFPTPMGATGIVAAHWNDLVTRTGVCVATIGAAPARSQVFEWFDAGECCGSPATGDETFEVVLNEVDGSIDMLYASLDDTRAAAVGVSEIGSSEFLAVCSPPAVCPEVTTGTRLRFAPIVP